MKRVEQLDEEPVDIVSSAKEFFELPSIPREDIWRMIERVDHGAQGADALFAKRMAGFIGTWLAAYAISRNVVSEGSIGSFKVIQLPLIVLVSPIVLAILQHNGVAIILASKVAGAIERAAYRKLFPNISRRHIDSVNFSVTPLGLEGIITGRMLKVNGFLWCSSGIMLIFLFAGPFALVGHGLYLAMSSAGYACWAKSLVAIVTGFVSLRTGLLLVSVFRFPDDE